MYGSNRDALSAVVARRRGKARLRAVTVAAGAAGLVVAGAVAYTLPGVTHTTTTTTASGTPATAGTTTVVHTTSGGSGVTTTQTVSGTGSASAPAASAGRSHATSGGS